MMSNEIAPRLSDRPARGGPAARQSAGKMNMPEPGLRGLRVLALEARRAKEIAALIRNYGGEPLVVPAMRELPLESNRAAFDFISALLRGEFDLAIFLTGVGVRDLLTIVDKQGQRETFLTALRAVKVAARGPKALAALREIQVPVAAVAPEPCTWHEMLKAIEENVASDLGGLRIAVQEYGAPSTELTDALTARNAQVTTVPVYRWALPHDLQPLREAVLALTHGQIELVLFLNAVQAAHLFQVAAQMGCDEMLRGGLQSTVIGSIGPSTSEELKRLGVSPDFEPSHPKMGFLVNEASQIAPELLKRKRSADGNHASAPGESITAPSSSAIVPAELDERRRQNFEFLHEIGSRMASADQFHEVLERIVEFVSSVVQCDSCFIYVLEQDQLVLRASKNPHADVVDHLGLRLGQGITGWVAEHHEPVAISSQALRDPRFKMFKDLPEDLFEAFLSVPVLSRGKLVGVINLQHRQPYRHTQEQVRLISTIGFLVGAEIERARLESENAELAQQLETRKAVERAKAILQRDFSISEEEAHRTLHRESRQRRKPMREIAEAILLNDDLRRSRLQSSPPPEPPPDPPA